jgi:putative membrane protein
MKKAIIMLFMAGTFAASAQTVSKCDKKFIECTASHGIFEVKTAQLALTKATTPEVKELAKTLESQRINSDVELKSIAVKKNVTLPTGLSKKQQKCYDKLAKEEGKKFDKCYAHKMAKCHKKELCKFKREAKKSKDADLKKFASGGIATLELHKEMAKKVCAAVKK